MNAQTLLDDADRIAATDLYPARCRTVIADLAAALRKSTSDLDESREYALALEAELARVKADSAAAQAMVVERAAAAGYRICAETRHVTLGQKIEAAIRQGAIDAQS